MGSYSLLSLSRSRTPELGPGDDYVEGTELAFKYGVAPAWYALFRTRDIVNRLSEEGYPEVFAFTDIESAKRNLADRSAALGTAIGERWHRGFEKFQAYLATPSATHVLLNATEYCEMFASGEDLRWELETCIGAFDVPYLTGKKRLFSRKPIVSEAWQHLLSPIDYHKGRPFGDQAWVVFGGSHDVEFD